MREEGSRHDPGYIASRRELDLCSSEERKREEMRQGGKKNREKIQRDKRDEMMIKYEEMR